MSGDLEESEKVQLAWAALLVGMGRKLAPPPSWVWVRGRKHKEPSEGQPVTEGPGLSWHAAMAPFWKSSCQISWMTVTMLHLPLCLYILHHSGMPSALQKEGDHVMSWSCCITANMMWVGKAPSGKAGAWAAASLHSGHVFSHWSTLVSTEIAFIAGIVLFCNKE